LICRFCEQWNPDSANRCCFCDNPADAVEDGTTHGTPAYIRNTGRQLQVPRAERSMFDERQKGVELNLGEMWRQGGSQRLMVIAGAVIALAIVLGMLIHNC